MADIIQRLPDAIANQIAAGEVIQRPASCVKELIENAVDAGATEVNLIIKDAGRTLIQVIDNGKGMSETDAVACFDRHATSKITTADDLWTLETKGFRGEALASIAGIAHVTLKTKLHDTEVGTLVESEGSEITKNEPTGCKNGTSIAVKNLFFNVPARRKFLKSNAVEMRHIVDEFQRVAMIHPEIQFTLHHNDNEVFHLETGIFRQRVVALFGKNFNEKLVPIEEQTNIVGLSGFICKPEYAKRTKGEQFLFVNGRFFKHNYLNHAIKAAYEGLIAPGSYASYFLHLQVDPGTIDVNIHPTKTEVKFEDEKSIYAILRSATKQSLGKFNIAPSIDFDQESSFDVPVAAKGPIEIPGVHIDVEFNPFENQSSRTSTRVKQPGFQQDLSQVDWETQSDFAASNEPAVSYDQIQDTEEVSTEGAQTVLSNFDEPDHPELSEQKSFLQLHNKYIVTQIRSGMIIINQKRAYERLYFDQFISSLATQQATSQRLLFPESIELSPTEYILVKDVWKELEVIGFELNDLGGSAIGVSGVPSEIAHLGAKKVIEEIIGNFSETQEQSTLNTHMKVALSMARTASYNMNVPLKREEIADLIDKLFESESPYVSPSDKQIINTLTIEDLNLKFNA